MIPLSALTRAEFRGAPSVLSRFNGFTSALVTSTAPAGRKLGPDARRGRAAARRGYADQGVGYAYSGQSFQERASSGQAGWCSRWGWCWCSWCWRRSTRAGRFPFAVLFGIPFGVLGAFLGVWLRGMPSDIYFQVGPA